MAVGAIKVAHHLVLKWIRLGRFIKQKINLRFVMR